MRTLPLFYVVISGEDWRALCSRGLLFYTIIHSTILVPIAHDPFG